MKYHIFKKIAKEVSKVFDVEESLIYSKNSTSSVTDARFLLYYVCVQENMKKVTIKNYMEKNGYTTGHSNIIYGINEVSKKLLEDRDYKVVIDSIQSNVLDCIH